MRIMHGVAEAMELNHSQELQRLQLRTQHLETVRTAHLGCAAAALQMGGSWAALASSGGSAGRGGRAKSHAGAVIPPPSPCHLPSCWIKCCLRHAALPTATVTAAHKRLNARLPASPPAPAGAVGVSPTPA